MIRIFKVVSGYTKDVFVQNAFGKVLEKACPTWQAGMLFNKHSLWVGAHYSDHTKRWCINLVPCLTLWFCGLGGREP